MLALLQLITSINTNKTVPMSPIRSTITPGKDLKEINANQTINESDADIEESSTENSNETSSEVPRRNTLQGEYVDYQNTSIVKAYDNLLKSYHSLFNYFNTEGSICIPMIHQEWVTDFNKNNKSLEDYFLSWDWRGKVCDFFHYLVCNSVQSNGTGDRGICQCGSNSSIYKLNLIPKVLSEDLNACYADEGETCGIVRFVEGTFPSQNFAINDWIPCYSDEKKNTECITDENRDSRCRFQPPQAKNDKSISSKIFVSYDYNKVAPSFIFLLRISLILILN